MKTRNEIYNREGERLIRMITTYHALLYEQVLLLFPRNKESLKTFINSLIKQGRIFYDRQQNVLCDCEDSALHVDYGLIAAFWVLLDFKHAILYHTSGNFPVKLHFFAQDEAYEIIYAATGQEALLNHTLSITPESDAIRLVILENQSQAQTLQIPKVSAYCLVSTDGTVSYYQKK
ncbi:DUF5697 family protein [Blautia coccoides]|uniref:Uncharacterized protein n=1 Tax=Blautia producta TaxID=33035 RepID=A0ABZ0UAV6_9FIRM|nr:DUF5697 family protein [Blautia coccoides]MCR1990117.1 DUF5697 family protein [Blautia coccoides]TCO45376.1 hypothetical protein EV205_1676 [Blautia coccoides]WPX72396.1 hypothetical protein BLCOC_07320 [Blautia coccoides]SUY05863.1 Uncharacterised protein [Blautia coccoides]